MELQRFLTEKASTDPLNECRLLSGERQLVVQKVGSSEPRRQFSTEDELIAFALSDAHRLSSIVFTCFGSSNA
jgi:hypothetical protein